MSMHDVQEDSMPDMMSVHLGYSSGILIILISE